MARWWKRNHSDTELVIATSDGTPIARIPGPIRLEMQYLFTRLELQDNDVPHSIGVTSAISGEGVTFVSRALAAVLSHDLGRRTCLVEANWWSEHDDETRTGDPGLAGVIAGDAEIRDVLIGTRSPLLSLINAGTDARLQRTGVSKTEALRGVIEQLRPDFDQIVFDLPAIATSATAMTFGAAVDGSILVARHSATRIDQIEDAVADLRHTPLLGIVLNDSRVAMPAMLQRRLIEA